MNERSSNLLTDKLSPNERYRDTLVKTEDYCRNVGADHRFVGGTIADLLSPTTQISFDIEQHLVTFKNYPPLTAFRPDGSIKDVDAIFFTESFKIFRTARQDFAFWQKTAKHNHIPFPAISVEAARHPQWPSRSNLKQFVTAWEIDSNGIPSLAFGSVRKSIDRQTIEPWTYKLEDDQSEFTGLNPFGFALCYVLRVPSGVKTKEKSPIIVNVSNGAEISRHNKIDLIIRFAKQADREAQLQGISLRDLHKEWIDYIHALQHTDDWLIRLKAKATRWYWKHLGEVAHGKGPLGLFSHLNDKMSG